MHLRSVYIWVYLGILGVLIFVLLRPSIDFHASAPVEMSRKAAEDKATQIFQELGIGDFDGLVTYGLRQQRVYFKELVAEADGSTLNLNPSILNESGLPLSGWRVTLAKGKSHETAIVGEEALFNEIGVAFITFDRQRRVRSFKSNPADNRAVVRGDSLNQLLNHVFTATGFEPAFYVLTDTLENPASFSDTQVFANQPQLFTTNDEHKVTWRKIQGPYRGPHEITLTYKTRILETVEGDSVLYEPAISVERIFSSYHPSDLDTPQDRGIDVLRSVLSFLMLLSMLFLVFIPGFRQIFRGEVTWRRGVVIFGVLIVGYIAHRFLTFSPTYYKILTDSVLMVDLLFYLLMTIAMSATTAIAYMSWEGYARRQEQEQVPHVDAVWAGNLFQKRIGKALVAGYGYAGLSLALWAIGLHAFRIVFYQIDSGLGFTDVATASPAFATLINSLVYTWITAFAFFALLMSLISTKIKRSAVVILLSSVIAGLFMATAVVFVSTSGTMMQEILVFSLMALPLCFAFRYYGIITVSTSIWVLFLAVRIGTYAGSADVDIALQGWIIGSVLISPLLIGLTLYHFGRDNLRSSAFVPEYEERMKKQLRMEREFQIAKESQFALMPKNTPSLEGADVKGFFIPSFEVGGDFYDHLVVHDEKGAPSELVLTVVDVSGKAMKAALTAIFTSGLLLSRVTRRDKDPSIVLYDVNNVVKERVDKQTFITCVLARFDLQTKELTYVNAGHCHPVLVRDGKARFLRSKAPRLPLGVKSSVDYVASTELLKTGDVLFLYSDGLPEARSKMGVLYEFDRVLDLFERVTSTEADSESICEKIKQEILTFSDYELADDLTLVAIRIL